MAKTQTRGTTTREAEIRIRDDGGLGGGGGGGTPDPPDALTEAHLVSFTASPTASVPFGPPVTLRWHVEMPAGPVHLSLNGVRVSATGTMEVQPAATTTYRLTANLLGFTRSLGSVTVGVEASACVTAPLPEDQVQAQLRAMLDAVDAQESRFSQRRAAAVSIDSTGIKVAVRLAISIDNFADPDLDVDFTIGLRVRDGKVEPYYRSFSVDVDWPWWVTTLTLGVTKIVEEVVEDKIEGALKPRILQEVTAAIDGVIALLPANLKLYRVVTQQDAIAVTVCPVETRVLPPHVVLGTGHPLEPVDVILGPA